MNSKELHYWSKSSLFYSYSLDSFFYIAITILCIIILAHCTSSQPLLPDTQIDNSIWMRSSSDFESNDDSISNPLFVHNEYNYVDQPNSVEPVRRANFWKRANFWRKRANFW
jgi:hypothetical protein